MQNSQRVLSNYLKNSFSIKLIFLCDFFKNIKIPKTIRSYEGHIRYAKNIEITDLHQLTKRPTVPFAAMRATDVDYNYLHDMWMHIRNQVSAHKANHTFKVLKIVWKEGLQSGKV